jgi:hypothetical protein
MTIGLHILYPMSDTTYSLLLHCTGLRVLKPIKINLTLKWCLTLKKYAPCPPNPTQKCKVLIFSYLFEEEALNVF